MSNWKLLTKQMPSEKKLVLFKWFSDESIQAGYYYWRVFNPHEPELIFIIGGNSLDGEEPTSWCEIPE